MKKLITIALLCTAVSLCGCSSKQQKPSQNDGSDDNIIIVPDTSQAPMGNERIKRPASPEVSAPDGSISIEEAYKLLDGCRMEDMYLVESMSTYKKYYFNTVDYLGEKYYSFYPYLEVGGKRIFVGTNVLVSCNGSVVLAKNWVGSYDIVTQAASQNDKPYTEKYPDAKISPNEALTAFAEKESVLGLEYGIEEYIFESNDTTSDINGIPCYRIIPKIEYLDHIDILGNYYVSADSSKRIFQGVRGKNGEYTELK